MYEPVQKWSHPGGHIFCKGLYREALTESTIPSSLIFSMLIAPSSFSYNEPGAKTGPLQRQAYIGKDKTNLLV